MFEPLSRSPVSSRVTIRELTVSVLVFNGALTFCARVERQAWGEEQ
jgi:hypothetical protein